VVVSIKASTAGASHVVAASAGLPVIKVAVSSNATITDIVVLDALREARAWRRSAR
jgi:hypothetical protein